MSKIRVALIGCGRVASKHIKAIANNNEKFELVSLCDLEKEKASKVLKKYRELNGCCNVNLYTDYKKMIENEKLDVAVIATESGNHFIHSKYCLSNSLNLIIEKPITLSMEEAIELEKLSEKKNLKVTIAYQNRFNPPIVNLKRAVDEGRFGKIINVSVRTLWNRNDEYYKQDEWRGTRLLDGGVLMNQSIHSIDLLCWVVNSDIEKMHVELDTFLKDIEMEDYGAALIRFKNGIVGYLEGSSCIYKSDLECSISVFGEKGTAIIGGVAVNQVKEWQFDDTKEYDYDLGSYLSENVYGEGHTMLYSNFYEAITKNIKPLIDISEAKKSLEIVLNAYQ